MIYLKVSGADRKKDGSELVTVQTGPDEFIVAVPDGYKAPEGAVKVLAAEFLEVAPVLDQPLDPLVEVLDLLRKIAAKVGV